MASFSTIIVAAGSGSRLGCRKPKAFISLDNRPLFMHSAQVFDACAHTGELILVVPKGYEAHTRTYCHELQTPVTVVAGDAQRWQSVHNGVDACASTYQWVMIHDAARPFVTQAVIEALWEKAATFRCAVTATPVVDTIRTVQDMRSCGTVDRNNLVRVGTPQLFDRTALIEVLTRYEPKGAAPTDEAQLMEHAGYCVGIAHGDHRNFKITVPYDLTLAEVMCAHKETL
jgi:2-C-methyl-D-erythritol 4-phosphate cytidylyltransferase